MFVEDVSDHWAKATIQIHFLFAFLHKQWPFFGPCQLQDRSGREWSGGATVCFCVSARVLLPFSPTTALPFEQTDCCGHAQGSCGRGIQSSALLLILWPTDHGTARSDPCASCNWTLQSHKSNTTTPFFDLSSQQEPRQSRHEPPVCPNCTTCFMNVYLRQQAFSK